MSTRSVRRRFPRRWSALRHPASRRSGSVQLRITDAHGLFQSFLIMNGDTLRFQLVAVIEGDLGGIRISTIPVDITAHIN